MASWPAPVELDEVGPSDPFDARPEVWLDCPLSLERLISIFFALPAPPRPKSSKLRGSWLPLPPVWLLDDPVVGLSPAPPPDAVPPCPEVVDALEPTPLAGVSVELSGGVPPGRPPLPRSPVLELLLWTVSPPPLPPTLSRSRGSLWSPEPSRPLRSPTRLDAGKPEADCSSAEGGGDLRPSKRSGSGPAVRGSAERTQIHP